MNITLKIVGISLLILWLLVQSLAARRGRRMSTGLKQITSWNAWRHRRTAAGAYFLLWANVVAGALGHFFARHQVGGQHGPTFLIHLPAAVTLILAMTVMLFWKDGFSSPRSHRWLALVVVLCTPIVAVTGLILWLNL